MQPTIPLNSRSFIIPDEYRIKLQDALQVSWYGRNMFRGLHGHSGDGGTGHKIKVYAAAVFGTLCYGTTSYFSITGAVNMAQASLAQDPVPADIGHTGEWLQQPFQYGFAIYTYLFAAFSSRGCLEEVKTVYAEIIAYLIEKDQKADISDFYQQMEDDILHLSDRCLSKTNLLKIRAFLVELFKDIDLSKFKCRPLKLDRKLVTHYEEILDRLKKSQSWSLANTKECLGEEMRVLARHGTGQAVLTGSGIVVFQIAMLATSAIMGWGLSAVVDEVFISKNAPESAGHLPDWTINILTNLFLTYVVYSWTIKKEAVLNRTQRVMQQYLQAGRDIEEGGLQLRSEELKRLCKTCNDLLDQLAAKCSFGPLPSQYRLSFQQ
jgi:hypothetical protein